MDPQQIRTDMLAALEQSLSDDAKVLAVSLLNWLHKGGFPPDAVGAATLGRKWHSTLASSGCEAAIRMANEAQRSHADDLAKGGD